MSEAIVLVPLDGTQNALAALPVGRVMAGLLKTDLHVVNVAQPRGSLNDLLGAASLPGEPVNAILDLPEGDPGGEILKLARDKRAGMIVMCSHTGTEKPRGQLGHVAVEIFLQAPCPVLLVQPDRGLQEWNLRVALLPHDGSPASANAIAPALQLVEQADAHLVLLHVRGMFETPLAEPGAMGGPKYIDQPQHEWPQWRWEFMERIRSVHAGALDSKRMQVVLATGAAGPEVARVARERQADLILIAWHGDLSPQRAQTLKSLIAEAPCPLMVFRVDKHKFFS